MQVFEITLRSGVATVREDELDELIQTLADIKHRLPERTYADNKEAYVTYEMAKAILRSAFSDESRAIWRLNRLWSAIVRFSMDRSIPYESYCSVCDKRLSEHARQEKPCRGMDRSSANAVVSGKSLRNCRTAFMAKTMGGVGPAIKDDYSYLVAHLHVR